MDGSGSGKSASYSIPNAYQMLGSYVFTDPKGELYDRTAGYLKEHGYEIKVLNLVRPQYSDGYNPLMHISSELDVDVIANTIVKGQKTDSGSDPYWDDMAEMLLKALIYYLIATRPEEEQNLASCAELVRAANKNGGSNLLTDLMNQLPYDHPARMNYKSIEIAPEKTYGSILSSLQSKLGKFDSKEIAELTSTDTINFEDIGNKKTAVYVISSDTHTAYDFLLTIFFSQMIQQLYDYADQNGGRLKERTYFILDEFANIGRIPNFDKITAVIRSNNIRVCIVLQSLPQLKALYKDNWESIIGNCSLFTYLGAPDLETRKYIVEKLDKTTVRIDTRGHSQGTTSGGSSSDNESYQGRDLLTTSELLRAFKASPKIKKKYGGYMIEFLDEYPPFWLYKFDTLSHPLIDKVGSSFPSGIPNNTDINKMYSDNEQIQKLKEVKTKMAQLMEQSVSEEKAMREQSVQKQAEQERVEQAELQRQFEEAARDAQLSEHQNVLAEIDEEELIADYEIPTIDEFIG